MSHIVTVITLNTKITTAYNFEKSTFPTNDVPNNTMYHANYLNILFVQILWHTWMNINSCQIDNAFRKKHSCETQLITVIDVWAKSWIKAGRLTLSFLTLRKLLTHPLMNYLNVSYMAMALVGRL